MKTTVCVCVCVGDTGQEGIGPPKTRPIAVSKSETIEIGAVHVLVR